MPPKWFVTTENTELHVKVRTRPVEILRSVKTDGVVRVSAKNSGKRNIYIPAKNRVCAGTGYRYYLFKFYRDWMTK